MVEHRRRRAGGGAGVHSSRCSSNSSARRLTSSRRSSSSSRTSTSRSSSTPTTASPRSSRGSRAISSCCSTPPTAPPTGPPTAAPRRSDSPSRCSAAAGDGRRGGADLGGWSASSRGSSAASSRRPRRRRRRRLTATARSALLGGGDDDEGLLGVVSGGRRRGRSRRATRTTSRRLASRAPRGNDDAVAGRFAAAWRRRSGAGPSGRRGRLAQPRPRPRRLLRRRPRRRRRRAYGGHGLGVGRARGHAAAHDLPPAQVRSELMEAVMQQWLQTAAGQGAAQEAARLQLGAEEAGQFFHARMLQSLGRLRLDETRDGLAPLGAADDGHLEEDDEAAVGGAALGFARPPPSRPTSRRNRRRCSPPPSSWPALIARDYGKKICLDAGAPAGGAAASPPGARAAFRATIERERRCVARAEAVGEASSRNARLGGVRSPSGRAAGRTRWASFRSTCSAARRLDGAGASQRVIAGRGFGDATSRRRRATLCDDAAAAVCRGALGLESCADIQSITPPRVFFSRLGRRALWPRGGRRVGVRSPSPRAPAAQLVGAASAAEVAST